jgi:hypothetical protein
MSVWQPRLTTAGHWYSSQHRFRSSVNSDSLVRSLLFDRVCRGPIPLLLIILPGADLMNSLCCRSFNNCAKWCLYCRLEI